MYNTVIHMKENIREYFNDLLKKSPLLTAVAAVKQKKQSRLFGNETRPLTGEEVLLLKKQGNRADDWAAIRVAQGFKTATIHNNSFSGECVLGAFSGASRKIRQGVSLPNGIYNSTIVNAEIGSSCMIRNTSLISRYLIKENAVVMGCGSLSSGADCSFGNGIPIAVGKETGGREVLSFAELDIETAGRLATRRGDQELQDAYRDFIAGYLKKLSLPYGVVDRGGMLLNSQTIENAYIGEDACIDGAVLVRNSTVLSGTDERTEISHGAYVVNSCVQWGCAVTTGAIVADSVLSEHSCVERQAKVTASIIGPNTVIGEGEVTSCLVGPFTAFHHQALLIAAVWPCGKGNVGYGANVGSNHTSRAPDQEIFCGEGMFFGLGVNIKFPADYSGAPYSIIATGVNTAPQKMEFPFSLIRQPPTLADGVSGYFNEIIPAWVLSDNLYMMMRNQEKYKNRNRAVRTPFNYEIFRPDIMDMVLTARNRLRAAAVDLQGGAATDAPDGASAGTAAAAAELQGAATVDTAGRNKVYTEEEIPGLGRNFLREQKRQKAEEAYTFCLEYYCLNGLYERSEELLRTGKETVRPLAAARKQGTASIYTIGTDNPRWEHQRGLLKAEGWDQRNPVENLERLIVILEKIAADTLRAKQKDDTKGEIIIADYKDSAVPAGDDEFVVSMTERTKQTVQRIREIIADLRAPA